MDIIKFLGIKNGKDVSEVKNFKEDQRHEKAYDRRERGIMAIPLAHIVGSVSRYADFDRQFRLKQKRPSSRLDSVKQAMTAGKTLPPVKLYQIKQEFYVLDGNHRVAAAKEAGREFIDAQVVEFIPSENSRANVLYREKQAFIEKTGLPDTIELTELGQYAYLEKQIEENRADLPPTSEGGRISIEAAAADWYGSVFRPLCIIIKNSRLLQHFDKRTVADLYAYITYQQWERARRREYGIGIDQLIPQNMKDFKKKMTDLKDFELPEMQHWISAFVLVTLKVGQEYRVMSKLYEMDEVQEVHFVHGEFDLLAKLVMKRDLLASDAEIIGKVVHEKVRRIPDVVKTQTLIPISSKHKKPRF